MGPSKIHLATATGNSLIRCSGTPNSSMRHSLLGAKISAPHDPSPSPTAPSVYTVTSGPTGENGMTLGLNIGTVMAMSSNAAASSRVDFRHFPSPAARS
eukprot:1682015-Amphidinium_carterae.2